MDIPVNEIITGRKCFFILPDLSLMPENFVTDLFALGFECYYIGNDGRSDIKKKINSILTLFKDVILYINIDYEVYDLKWPEYIRELLTKKATRDQFGIVFSKRQSAVENQNIEQIYFKILELQKGFIQLEYQRKFNFEIIARTLFNNQAQGRRKAIRAICSKTCTYKFNYGENKDTFFGSLQDISLSHFTILVEDAPLSIKLYEKIHDIHFSLKGYLFQSDAILVMERAVDEKKLLYVFSFVTSTGANGLDDKTKAIIVPVLHEMVSANCIELLNKEYLKEMQEAQDLVPKEDPKAAIEVKISAEQEMDPEIAALYVESETEKEETTESEKTEESEEKKEE
ncbi:MAG: hypothetical protein J5710_13440 [Treponema sp.]|nr:hypothetical protein [Treponema sp.]